MDKWRSLATDLKLISRVFDIKSLLTSKPNKKDITRYYAKNRLAYRVIQSWDGFVHFAISSGNRFRQDDLKEQARIVDSYIQKKKATRVLELAYGMGANSAYLARLNPDVSFEAIDYSNVPLGKYKKIPNLDYRQGDYHNFAKGKRYDIIFIIESLCHTTKKRYVFEQAYESLSPGGLFIIFDGYSRKPNSALSKEECEMKKLCEIGMALPALETPQDLESYGRPHFNLIVKRDFSGNVIPNAKYFHDLAKLYFHFPRLARLINRIISLDIVKNALPALLLYDSLCLRVSCYYVHVFKKK